jgi:hypothetical protein
VSEELNPNAVDEIFGTLPVDIQANFTRLWNEPLHTAIARRGAVPDPTQQEAVEVLLKMFYVHGYVAHLQSVRDEMRVLTDLADELRKSKKAE